MLGILFGCVDVIISSYTYSRVIHIISCIYTEPTPVSDLIIAAAETATILEDSTSVNIILPRFSEEDGIIR